MVDGESHDVDTTYSTYQEMLEFGPKTEKEQAANQFRKSLRPRNARS